MGVTFASFHEVGKVHERMEFLKITNSGRASVETQFFKKTGDIPSGPQEMSSLRVRRAVSTSAIVKLISPKWWTGGGGGRGDGFKLEVKKLL
jgi:hypothetical protein